MPQTLDYSSSCDQSKLFEKCLTKIAKFVLFPCIHVFFGFRLDRAKNCMILCSWFLGAIKASLLKAFFFVQPHNISWTQEHLTFILWVYRVISEASKLRILVWSRLAPGKLGFKKIWIFINIKYHWNRFVSGFVFLDIGRHQSGSLLWNRYAQTCWDQAGQ